jgi:uncharacterized membrane protein
LNLLRLLKRELAAEARSWVDEQIVSEEQAGRILDRYGARLPDGTERSVGYIVLLSLAALFAGLSILVFVSANWDEIPRGVRMVTLVALTLAFHALGLKQQRAANPMIASVWFLLGCLTYGTSIFLIAQIYHLGEHYPDGIWWWAVGTLPFVILTRSRAITWLMTAVALIWLGTETSETFFPVSWPLFAAVIFWFCLSQKQSLLLFLTNLIATTFWIEILFARYLGEDYLFAIEEEHVPLTLGLFVIYYALGKWMETRTDRPRLPEYGMALRLWSLRLGLVVLLVFSFAEAWEAVMKLQYESPAWVWGWLVVVTGVTGAFLHRIWVERGPRAWWDDGLSALAYLVFFALIVLISLVMTEKNEDLAIGLQLLGNLACVGSGIWLILRALRDSVTLYFYTGVGVILILALLRYADLVGDYIGGSLLFLFFAGVLFGAARFWRAHIRKGAPS